VRLLRHAGAVAALLTWVGRALGRAHLVEVAAALHHQLGLDVDGLRQLRLPVDLLAEFPRWRQRSTEAFAPRSLGLTLVPGGAGDPVGTVRLQVSTPWGGTAVTLGLAHALLRRLDPAARVVVLVDPDTSAADVRRLARQGLGRQPRLRLAQVDFGTIFARDNAMAARDRRGRPVLLVPRALRTEWDAQALPLAPAAARRRLGVRVLRSRLYWHGGNVLFDGEALAVGADTIAENVSRLGLSAAEVLRVLAAETGCAATVLGTPRGRFDPVTNRIEPSGQASYHVDLDVALLGRGGDGRPVALVADPRRGLALLPAVLAHRRLALPPWLPRARARALLAREYRAAAREREPALRDYGERLASRGYRVVGVPELRTRPRRETVLGLSPLDLVYCNVLPGLNRGRRAVHYLPWGIPALDAEAERGMRAAGAAPVRVARTPDLATAMMERVAGLRCFCGAMP
jgi:hypothetical protein